MVSILQENSQRMLRRAIGLINLGIFTILLLIGSALNAVGAQSEIQTSPAVSAQLVFAQDGIVSGAGTLSGGLVLDLQPGWKTYWRSPGEVGVPPQFNWEGSTNLTDVRQLWPAPKRFTAFGIENFGYEARVVFPLEFTLDRPGTGARFELELDLLVCSDICVPEKVNLSHSLPEGGGLDAVSAKIIAEALAQVPAQEMPREILSTKAYVDPGQTELIAELTASQPFEKPDLFPEFGAGTAFGKPEIRMSNGGKSLWARFPINGVGPVPAPLSLTVTDQMHGAFTVQPERLSAPLTAPYALSSQGGAYGALVWFALVALLGGLILNVMPCVLPVLAIKVSALATSSGQTKDRIRAGLLATTLGVMLFMWLLAGSLITLKYIGVTVGWGIQFQNPLFLILLITILMVFIGNLFGAFEITLPSSLQTRMDRAGGSKYFGDVFTGFFAAMLATPCSAPFLGTAVAFALTGRSIDIAVVFTALGLGLALPYLIIALRPGLATALPKPGPWMVWVRRIMALFLVGTVAWLAWVMVGVAGSTATAVTVLAGVIIVAMLVGGRRYGPGLVLATLPALALTLVVVPALLTSDAEMSLEDSSSLNWVPFDRAGIARHVSRGHVVFVDVTADWCVTCKANKALVLEKDPVSSALSAEGVIAMQADWTRPNDTIARYLQANNRFGIPFNAVYGPGVPNGIILPEILRTPKVLEALESAKLSELRVRLNNLATR